MVGADEILELLREKARARAEWERVEDWARNRYGRDPSVESLLFLIGIQSREGDFSPRLKKEMKQDLIMEGTCAVFETIGLYRKNGTTWEKAGAVPILSEPDQERLLKIAIARYLEPTLGKDSRTP
jgi:hypothetical protein